MTNAEINKEISKYNKEINSLERKRNVLLQYLKKNLYAQAEKKGFKIGVSVKFKKAFQEQYGHYMNCIGITHKISWLPYADKQLAVCLMTFYRIDNKPGFIPFVRIKDLIIVKS